ncbi:MAG TPA: peptidoglycan-binding domain-containing protein [Rhizomicrobium sp.]|jgi:hypothetical protein|nr:peptidoglycan-binding domain-containing protein [Rhizomicrobium sp.]
MSPPYLQPGLTLSPSAANTPALVQALQRDLRALGYLRHGIDGQFGAGTALAIRSLRIDLMHNSGAGSDGHAPVAIASFNDDGAGGKRVTQITDDLDQSLAQCLAAMLADPRVTTLPYSDDPKSENAKALAAIGGTVSTTAPSPFIAAMIIQESDGAHYNVPRTGDSDSYVTVGLDRNDAALKDRITSRGYGIDQYTFFHHPLSAAQMAEFVADPVRNAQNGYKELRDKFDHFLVGPASTACDRDVEHPHMPLRLCKYQLSDARYMRDCKACAMAARKVDIARGTPAYDGATFGYQPDQYYPSADYMGVPDRADFQCDWPYAARRYNGSGNNSFHYQARILLNLLK